MTQGRPAADARPWAPITRDGACPFCPYLMRPGLMEPVHVTASRPTDTPTSRDYWTLYYFRATVESQQGTRGDEEMNEWDGF